MMSRSSIPSFFFFFCLVSVFRIRNVILSSSKTFCLVPGWHLYFIKHIQLDSWPPSERKFDISWKGRGREEREGKVRRGKIGVFSSKSQHSVSFDNFQVSIPRENVYLHNFRSIWATHGCSKNFVCLSINNEFHDSLFLSPIPHNMQKLGIQT